MTFALGDVFLPLHGARPSFIVALWRSPRFCGRCLRGSLVAAVAWHHERTRQPFWRHPSTQYSMPKNDNLELANLVPGPLSKRIAGTASRFELCLHPASNAIATPKR